MKKLLLAVGLAATMFAYQQPQQQASQLGNATKSTHQQRYLSVYYKFVKTSTKISKRKLKSLKSNYNNVL